ncbi:hypothetical protein [Pseudomonas sp. SMN5]|uniref:hypothetical protein n=1 Tax=Pseudomonas sp. SMN5 TaxID=3390198 RepID=UPI003F8362D4
MSNNIELKRLAEAAPGGPWIVENDSLYFKDDGYTRHLLDADAGHDVEEENYSAALDFIAAADPAAVLALLAEIDQLKGLMPGYPPRPPDGEGLPRYGLRWNGPQQPLAVPMDNGYWTPWHLADQLRAENEALRQDAERWRFFSVLANDLQAFPHSWGQMTPEKMNFMCDEAMAAAGKEVQP